jgi:hypothetical protein
MAGLAGQADATTRNDVKGVPESSLGGVGSHRFLYSGALDGQGIDSYHAWAERALKCGFPGRFAQQALGHNSKAVHRAYAKHAEVTVPSLDDWKKDCQEKPQRRLQPKLLAMVSQSSLVSDARSN